MSFDLVAPQRNQRPQEDGAALGAVRADRTLAPLQLLSQSLSLLPVVMLVVDNVYLEIAYESGRANGKGGGPTDNRREREKRSPHEVLVVWYVGAMTRAPTMRKSKTEVCHRAGGRKPSEWQKELLREWRREELLENEKGQKRAK